jgi:hypothetical protein
LWLRRTGRQLTAGDCMLGRFMISTGDWMLLGWLNKNKWTKVSREQAEVARRFRCSFRPRIFSTFGTTRLVSRQPNATTTFTPGEIPGTHFQRLSRPQSTWFCRKEPRKISQTTPPGIDLRTVRLAAQNLNHYATPSPLIK